MLQEKTLHTSYSGIPFKNFYAVTLGTHEREFILGDLEDDDFKLNEAGELARECWLELPKIYPYVSLDHFIIMPNQLQGIIHVNPHDISNEHCASWWSRMQSSMIEFAHRMNPFSLFGNMVRHFKAKSTYLVQKQMPKRKLWQRNHYEHVIRDVNDLNRLRDHIATKPSKWKLGR